MRPAFVLFFISLRLISNAQVDTTLSSNEWYFSKENIWRYNAKYINSKSISNIKEHLKDKDSLILISDYSFNQKGFLTKVKNYDVHGIHTSSTIFEISELGNILKKRYYNGKEWKTLKDFGTKQTQNTISDNNTTRIIKKRWIIEKKYDSDGSLSYISKKKFNSDSLIAIEIFDRRSVVRKSHNRRAEKAPFHVPQITRYKKTTYKYSKKGQLSMIKHFNNPFTQRSKRQFIYSGDGILIRMERIRKGMSDQTWIYETKKNINMS